MSENSGTTRGIAPAQTGALAVLQHTVHARSGEKGFADDAEVRLAAREIGSYHAPSEDQIDRLGTLTAALEDFLLQVVRVCPPGPERSTAISRAREAKFWAASAIALEGR